MVGHRSESDRLGFLLLGLVAFAETLAEFLDSTHCVYELLTTGVEGVRGRRDVDVNDGILVTIFPLNGFFGSHGRLSQNGEVSRFVLEDYGLITWMGITFHGFTLERPVWIRHGPLQ